MTDEPTPTPPTTTTDGATATTAGDPTPTPAPTPHTRRNLLILLGIAVVAVAAILTVTTLNDPARQVRAVVADYLRALETGDGEAAAALADLPDTLACPDLLTAEVYESATARPTGAEISDLRTWPAATDGDGVESAPSASVDVVYQRGEGGERRSDRLSLERGPDGWRILPDDGLGPQRVEVSAVDGTGAAVPARGSAELSVNGACGDLEDAVTTFHALPGTYELATSDPERVELPETLELTVPTGRAVTLTSIVDPAVIAEVTAQARGWIAECTATGWTGPACQDSSIEIPRYIAPTAGGLLTDVVVQVGRLGDDGAWRFGMTAQQPVDGTLVCDDAGPSCIPGDPITATLYFHYRGTIAVGADGAVTLTRDSA